jgi:hypothetical protein
VLYVPTARGWDDAVPEWLRGRRDQVLAYLARESDHRLVETDDGYSAAERDGRSLEAVGDAETARSIAERFLQRAAWIGVFRVVDARADGDGSEFEAAGEGGVRAVLRVDGATGDVSVT